MQNYTLNLQPSDYVLSRELGSDFIDTDPALNMPALVQKPEDATADGCLIYTNTRHITIPQGVENIVEWQVRTREGYPVVLTQVNPEWTAYIAGGGHAKDPEAPAHYLSLNAVVRFRCCDGSGDVIQITAYPQSPDEADVGIIRFLLTSELTDLSGVFRAEIGIGTVDNAVVFTEPWLLFVERGMFGDTSQRHGPPTLTEIRMALRDSEAENNLLQAVEFTADEIVYAITRPIQEWNESPPPVGCYSCSTFPWREAWLKAIIAILLQTSAHHYMRNKLAASHGGLTVDDKNKNAEYMQMSMQYRQEWKDFMITKKVQINAGLAMGSIGSSYGRFY